MLHLLSVSQKTLCLLAFVLTGIEMKGFITLRGNSEVQVQSKGAEMKTEEVLQTDWLADQWEETHRDGSEEKG